MLKVISLLWYGQKYSENQWKDYGDLGENPAETQQPFPGLWT